MKKVILLLVTCIFTSLGLQAQTIVSGLVFNTDTITLGVDSTAILTVTVSPPEASDKSVSWLIEYGNGVIDTTLVSDGGCTITGLEPGEARITVISSDNGALQATCNIRVIIPVDSIVLKDDSLDMILGRDTILVSKLYPFDTDDTDNIDVPTFKTITWTSSDSSVVDIISVLNDSICTLRALSCGEAKIFVESFEGEKIDSCVITVGVLGIDSVVMSRRTLSINTGNSETLVATIFPLYGTNDSIKWTSSDYSIVTFPTPILNPFDTIRTIKALSAGEAIIYATTVDGGKKDSCVVTVSDFPTTSITLSNDSIILELDSLYKLTATVLPNNASNKYVTWISTDSSAVTIISTAVNRRDTVSTIKAVGEGSATIYAIASDGVLKDSCYVSVYIPVDSIVLSSDLMVVTGNDERVHMNLKDDTVAVIRAKVYPDSATYKSLSWRLLGSEARIDSIPTIHNDTICHIKALKAGVDTLLVTSDNGIESRFCYIAIDPREVDSVKIDKGPNVVNDTIPLIVNSTFELVTTIFPLNATNDTLRVESSDPTVARIDSTSTSVSIRALKEGRTIVYVTPMDGQGGKKDSCIIEVKSMPLASISLNKDTVYIYEQEIDFIIATMTPANASNKAIEWTSSKPSVVIQPSTGNDTICTFKGISADTTLIYAVSKENSAIKDSCVVIVKEQYVFLKADTATVNGIIEVSVVIPDGIGFNGAYFEVQFPKGFGLTKEGNGYKTALTNEAKIFADLSINKRNDSTFFFSIDPKTTSPRMFTRAVTPTKIMNIYYTIFDNTLTDLNKVYDVKFKDITVSLSDDTFVKEDHVVKIKVFNDPTANDIFENTDKLPAYCVDGLLYVNSDKAETVYVYSLNGTLLYMKNKAEGQAVFSIKTDEKVLIVKGSSGWAGKVGNR